MGTATFEIYQATQEDIIHQSADKGYLADIDKHAEDMFFRLVEQMAEREGVTEQLKAESNGMGWSDEQHPQQSHRNR